MNAFEFDFLHHKIVYLRSPGYSPLRADLVTIARSFMARPGQSVAPVPTRCTGRRAEQG